MSESVQKVTGRVNACDVLTLSAYGIAVKNGFKGTEEEWLKSLNGGLVSVDKYLHVDGHAADAKVTGEKIINLGEEVSVERARVTNLAKLKEGSTTGDAELQDIRVGFDGTTYSNAGEAVRKQVGNLRHFEDGISKEISGMEYAYRLNWEVGSLLTTASGNYKPGDAFTGRKDRIYIAEYFPFDEAVTVKAVEGRGVIVCFYDADKNFISHQGYSIHPIKLADYADIGAVYFRVSAQNIAGEEIPNIEYISDYVQFSSTEGLKAEIEELKEAVYSDVPKSMAVANTLMKAKQLTDVKYTAKATLPYQRGDFAEGTELTGLIYSSTRVDDKLVGINISLHTFMTAIQNPKSVVYTKRVYNPGYGLEEGDPGLPALQNALTYYGIVCSSFVCYCLGIPYNMTTYQMVNHEDLEETSVYDIQLADCMVTKNDSTNHTILITGIKRDKYGRIVEVETSESGYPTAKVTKYSFDKFLDTFVYDTGNKGTSYRFFRYKKLWQSTYTPSEYVAVYDENPAAVTYPDIITNYGDKATVTAGTNIEGNVINRSGYTGLEVYRDGTLLGSYPVEDRVIAGATAGLYEFRLVGSKTSSSYILVADCNVSCEDVNGKKRIHFSSSNSIPQNWSFAHSNYANLKIVEFTAEDIARGYFDVDLSEYPSNHKYIKVYFKNEYGTVSTVAYAR